MSVKLEGVPVSVDADFARFGNKSYAINKINSVEVRHRQPYSSGAPIAWGLLSLICALAILGSAGVGQAVFYIALAALFGFLAYRAWEKSKIVEYQLFLMTSSSETQALASRDTDQIQRLRDQIERAMAGKLSH